MQLQETPISAPPKISIARLHFATPANALRPPLAISGSSPQSLAPPHRARHRTHTTTTPRLLNHNPHANTPRPPPCSPRPSSPNQLESNLLQSHWPQHLPPTAPWGTTPKSLPHGAVWAQVSPTPSSPRPACLQNQ